MLKCYFYISLLFQATLFSIPAPVDPWYVPKKRTYKDDSKDRENIEMFIFLIEKFHAGRLCFQDSQEQFSRLKQEAEPLLLKREFLRKLYIESHDKLEKQSEVQSIIERDSQALSELWDKLLNFSNKCKD